MDFRIEVQHGPMNNFCKGTLLGLDPSLARVNPNNSPLIVEAPNRAAALATEKEKYVWASWRKPQLPPKVAAHLLS